MAVPTCTLCQSLLAASGATATPVLCGLGRTQVYGASAAECALFRTDETAFDAVIDGWLAPVVDANGTVVNPDPYPGCRDSLEIFFCAQTPVHQVDEDNPSLKAEAASACSDYRRPYHGHGLCRSFCSPLKDACPPAAHAHCEEHCRTSSSVVGAGYCDLVEVSGLGGHHWNADAKDMNNLYRLEAEAGNPLLREGRPIYRSIPALRSDGSARATKLDYYIYATRLRGFTEWLIDTNDIADDGAAAYVSASNLAPYLVNSDWNVWSTERREWAAHVEKRRQHGQR